MAKGRPTIRDEANILKYYNSLMPKCFEVVNEAMNSKNKGDRRWAADWLKNAYMKMVPQAIVGEDGGPIEFTITHYGEGHKNLNPVQVSA